jgi:hypothetical protein
MLSQEMMRNHRVKLAVSAIVMGEAVMGQRREKAGADASRWKE